jgi:hypothetical protein
VYCVRLPSSRGDYLLTSLSFRLWLKNTKRLRERKWLKVTPKCTGLNLLQQPRTVRYGYGIPFTVSSIGFLCTLEQTSKEGFILSGRQNLGQIWVKPFAGFAPIVRRLDSNSSWGFQITNLKNFVPWSGAAYPNLSQRSDKKCPGPADLRTKTMDQCNDAIRHSWSLPHLLEIETIIAKHQSFKSGWILIIVQ